MKIWECEPMDQPESLIDRQPDHADEENPRKDLVGLQKPLRLDDRIA
jgi:hypothetical protein